MLSTKSLALGLMGAMAVGVAQVAADAEIIDNSDVASWVRKQAVKLTGDYTITNPATGQSLIYLHDQHHNIVPMTEDKYSNMKSKATSKSGKDMGFLATDVFKLISEGDKDGAVLVANPELGKAMAASWGGHYDKWGVPLAYTKGSNRHHAPYKFLWYFVPCDSSAQKQHKKTAEKSSFTTSKQAYKQKFGGKSKKGKKSSHRQMARSLEEQNLEVRMEDIDIELPEVHADLEEGEVEIEKRGKSSGLFCLVAQDHIDDMSTRALTAKPLAAYDNMDGTTLLEWDQEAILDTQVWKVAPA